MAAVTCDYELERQQRINENKARLAEMGLLRQKSILESFREVKNTNANKKKTYIRKAEHTCSMISSPRRSKRLRGDEAEFSHRNIVEDEDRFYSLDEDVPLVDLMDRKCSIIAPKAPSEQQLAEIQLIRCSSQGRGSVYDSKVGITCHFCRQKKLCGEENCPRCSNHDANQECIGKTECSRCHSAFGRFCRACLLIRYGMDLETVQKQMAEGTWLCPHCYEEEHPDDGWICNSSICMKRRGLRPTGIAIYDAQERGFKSVGHLLQAQLKARGGVCAAIKCGGKLEATTAEPCTSNGPAGAPAAAAVADAQVAPEPCHTQAAVVQEQAAAAKAALPPKAPARPLRGAAAPATASAAAEDFPARRSIRSLKLPA